jgi:hypothetical protein
MQPINQIESRWKVCAGFLLGLFFGHEDLCDISFISTDMRICNPA